MPEEMRWDEESPGEEQPVEAEAVELEPDRPASQWDLAFIEGPLFGTEEVTEFTQSRVPVYGKWNLRPHLTASTIYDGNVFIQEEGKEADLITRIAPGVSIRLGDESSPLYLVADYTAGFLFFASKSDQNSVDNSLKLDLQWSLPKTLIGFHIGYLGDTGTSIDATDRIERNIYYAGITTNHTLSDKTSIDLNADYRIADYSSGLFDYNEARIQSYFNYQILPKVTLGIGGVYGHLEPQDAPSQNYQEASLRVLWVATGKITVSGNAGVEFRQFGGGDETFNPVFGLDVAYQITNGTKISFNARRRIFSSVIFQGQNYTATGFTFSISQRLTDRCNLFLTFGYENLDYTSAAPGVEATREDHYFFIRPGVQFRLTQWLALGLFYEYSQNSSSGELERSFRRDRLGVQLGITF